MERSKSELAPREPLEELAVLERLLTAGLEPNDETAAVVAAARRHAESVVEAGAGTSEAIRSGLVIFVADVVNGIWLEREWRAEDVDDLLEGMHSLIGAPVEYLAMNVALRALGDPSLLELPPSVAIEAQLGILVAFAPVRNVSLWGYDRTGRLACLFSRGAGAQSRRARQLASATIASPDAPTVGGSLLQAIPVRRWEMTCAVLVARPVAGRADQCRICLREAASMLGPVFERHALLERSASRERMLVESSERRLSRMAFDLHDGPIQEVAAVLSDLRLFRRQLGRTAGDEGRDLLVGRVDDLDARLVALDANLRELSHSIESSAAVRKPFRDVLESEAEAFRRATRIALELDLSGNFEGLTASQRIALLRIVQEALTNVREHSRAKHVTLQVRERQGHLQAKVEDDGQGFDLQRAKAEALHRGSLGLIGMMERARLLGGRCEVHSSPGGPTRISVVLPKWEPVAIDRRSAAPPQQPTRA
jgi:signal transduction histidine kinase